MIINIHMNGFKFGWDEEDGRTTITPPPSDCRLSGFVRVEDLRKIIESWERASEYCRTNGNYSHSGVYNNCCEDLNHFIAQLEKEKDK